MLTQQRRTRELAARWIDCPAQCLYNGKLRRGKIVAIKQGPAVRGKTADGVIFNFLDQADGDVYVFWNEEGTNRVRTFRWDGVTALISQSVVDQGDKKKADSITEKFSVCIVVPRVRPVIGG